MMVRRIGGGVIRGSSSHTGARSLRDYYQALVKENLSPVITPDGPTGPRFKFKPGAILLAQMSGRPMLPMAYAASRAWLVKWDKFVIPVPFARIVIAIGAASSTFRGLLTLRAWRSCKLTWNCELKELYAVAASRVAREVTLSVTQFNAAAERPPLVVAIRCFRRHGVADSAAASVVRTVRQACRCDLFRPVDAASARRAGVAGAVDGHQEPPHPLLVGTGSTTARSLAA